MDSNSDFTEPVTKNTKTKKPKPKKRARPKLTIDTSESYEEKADDEMPLDSASAPCETPRTPTQTKSKRKKGTKKRRKSSATTPPKAKFDFLEVTSHEDSFSENSSSVSPSEIAKEVVATAARKMEEAQKSAREMASDKEDEVFTASNDGRDGLSLLARASFATADKSTKRKRSESEDLSQKKRGRPKKDTESAMFEPGNVLLANVF